MKMHQLSLFIENRPGQLASIAKSLGKAGIDIVTMSLADTQQFGIFRLIVKDWAAAKQVLEQAGCVVNVTPVLPIAVPHRPGGLAEVLAVMENAAINVEYMYPFPCGGDKAQAVVIFRVENPDTAEAALKAVGMEVMDAQALLR